jgi:DNA repair protein RadC
MMVRELRVTYAPAKPPLSIDARKALTPTAAASVLRARLASEPVEVVIVLLLNTKHRVIGLHEVGRGTLNACLVHPRDVFKVALLANAAGVIVGHNHPSGDATPSPEDIELCLRLRAAGTVVGVDLLDFLIVTEEAHTSFLEQRL